MSSAPDVILHLLPTPVDGKNFYPVINNPLSTPLQAGSSSASWLHYSFRAAEPSQLSEGTAAS